MSDDVPLSPATDTERGNTAWWFRQITVSLGIGNAGGIVALATFAGSASNLDVAVGIVYPAIAFFFTGMIGAFAAFIVQFVYTFLRLEARAEVSARKNEIRVKGGKPLQVDGVSTVVFFILCALIAFSLGSSAVYFYRGAYAVTQSAAELACDRAPNSSKCQRSPTPIFPIAIRSGASGPSSGQAGKTQSENDSQATLRHPAGGALGNRAAANPSPSEIAPAPPPVPASAAALAPPGQPPGLLTSSPH